MHEIEYCAAETKTLGCRLDCIKHRTKLTVERRLKVTKVIRAVLRRRTVSGICIAVILEHATLCCLTNRLALSMFHIIYRYIRSSYYDISRLWDSVREELNCFLGVFIFMERCWRLPWVGQSFPRNASDTGWGIASGEWTQEACADVGRQGERKRFKLAHATQARAHAFAAYGLLEYLPDNAEYHDSAWV